MHHVTDRASNPFGMRAPCEHAVYGYGDPNADFHVVGDHPGVHGGLDAGRPFGDTAAGQRLLSVLADVGFVDELSAEDPVYDDLFTSYRHMCATPDGRAPTDAEYDRLERFFDAELRAINAHVLLPVGQRATRDTHWLHDAGPQGRRRRRRAPRHGDSRPGVHGCPRRGPPRLGRGRQGSHPV